jgi:hypothetical protein
VYIEFSESTGPSFLYVENPIVSYVYTRVDPTRVTSGTISGLSLELVDVESVISVHRSVSSYPVSLKRLLLASLPRKVATGRSVVAPSQHMRHEAQLKLSQFAPSSMYSALS